MLRKSTTRHDLEMGFFFFGSCLKLCSSYSPSSFHEEVVFQRSQSHRNRRICAKISSAFQRNSFLTAYHAFSNTPARTICRPVMKSGSHHTRTSFVGMGCQNKEFDSLALPMREHVSMLQVPRATPKNPAMLDTRGPGRTNSDASRMDRGLSVKRARLERPRPGGPDRPPTVWYPPTALLAVVYKG